jgi:hypothetical protein
MSVTVISKGTNFKNQNIVGLLIGTPSIEVGDKLYTETEVGRKIQRILLTREKNAAPQENYIQMYEKEVLKNEKLAKELDRWKKVPAPLPDMGPKDQLLAEELVRRGQSPSTLSDLITECKNLYIMGVKNIDPTVVGRTFLKTIGLTTTEGLCTKQDRYKAADGKDTIDKWAERYTAEEFRVIMWIQMEKYNDRLGKKDTVVNEVRKIADYSARWLEKEERG